MLIWLVFVINILSKLRIKKIIGDFDFVLDPYFEAASFDFGFFQLVTVFVFALLLQIPKFSIRLPGHRVWMPLLRQMLSATRVFIGRLSVLRTGC